ncbi:capsular polysaccharide export protein, LipB/KpsS family [Pseudomonas abietaniphila]
MKILLYVEPHPIRDSLEEFSGIGTFLTEALLNAKKTKPLDLRVFSNNAVIDIICNKIPNASMICERPSGIESRQIEEFKTAWNKENIDTWIDLTNATGQATALYTRILERLHDKYPFDAVVLWSENGAVRRFCNDRSLIALHGELGPTRPPFEETIYFDPAGTNGNVSARSAKLSELSLKALPPETWLGQKSRYENSPDGIGIVDMPYTAVPDEISQSIKFPYIYIPLQLADDLNTIKNSEFEGPLDFLKKTLPVFIEQGYNIVIKPHPGSLTRPYNLIEETKALAYARSLGADVTILDRKITVTRSLRLIVQSSFVCTINSSVGYEALLLGKQALILGDAAYDIGGKLKSSLLEIRNLSILAHKREHVKRLVNFVSGHILIPKSEVAKGTPITGILSFLKNLQALGIEHDQATYWQMWAEEFAYGLNWLGHKEKIVEQTVDPTEIFGNIELLSASNKKIKLDERSLILTALEGETTSLAGAASLAPRHFIVHVDHLAPSESIKNGTTIRGWAMDEELRQASVILTIQDGNVLCHYHKVQQRMDVADFLKGLLPNSSLKSIPAANGFQIDVAVSPNMVNECDLALISADNKVSVFRIKLGRLEP